MCKTDLENLKDSQNKLIELEIELRDIVSNPILTKVQRKIRYERKALEIRKLRKIRDHHHLCIEQQLKAVQTPRELNALFTDLSLIVDGTVIRR